MWRARGVFDPLVVSPAWQRAAHDVAGALESDMRRRKMATSFERLLRNLRAAIPSAHLLDLRHEQHCGGDVTCPFKGARRRHLLLIAVFTDRPEEFKAAKSAVQRYLDNLN
jgi:hypothetical protein